MNNLTDGRRLHIDKIVDSSEWTVLEKKFMMELEKTLDPTRAALKVCNFRDDATTSKRQRASVRASSMMKKLGFKIGDILDCVGVTDERIAKKLSYKLDCTKKFMTKFGEVEYEDNESQLHAVEVIGKFKGYIRDNQVNIQNNHFSLTEEEARIIKELK
jgi:hypothetical protein